MLFFVNQGRLPLPRLFRWVQACMEFKLSDAFVNHTQFLYMFSVTEKIEQQKKSLERCQSLEEVQRLHEAEDYKRVVHLLLPTVLQPSMGASGKAMSETSTAVPERRAQLELLNEALIKLEDYSVSFSIVLFALDCKENGYAYEFNMIVCCWRYVVCVFILV